MTAARFTATSATRAHRAAGRLKSPANPVAAGRGNGAAARPAHRLAAAN